MSCYSNWFTLLLLCTSAPLVWCCDRFDCGSSQVKREPLHLVTKDYGASLCQRMTLNTPQCWLFSPSAAWLELVTTNLCLPHDVATTLQKSYRPIPCHIGITRYFSLGLDGRRELKWGGAVHGSYWGAHMGTKTGFNPDCQIPCSVRLPRHLAHTGSYAQGSLALRTSYMHFKCY